MGLTIHFSLSVPSKWTIDRVVEALGALHRDIRWLGAEQTRLVILTEQEIASILADQDHDLRWAVVQHSRHHRYQLPTDHSSAYRIRVIAANKLVGFTVDPGDGSEPLNVFVGRYPSAVHLDEGSKRTRLPGPHSWIGKAFCKTQYANDPECGGTTNFLLAHLRVIAVLDAASRRGFNVVVDDEGGYWRHRDPAQLLQHVEQSANQIQELRDVITKALGGPPVKCLATELAGKPLNAQAAVSKADLVLQLIKATRPIAKEKSEV